jgi:hypothetical protein
MDAMGWMKCLVAAAVLAVLSAAAAPAEEEAPKIDCADIDVHIKAADFEATCKDYSSVVAASSLGRLKAELFTAISQKQNQFVAVWDIRTLGATYLPRSGLEDDIHSFFSDEKLDEWKAAEPIAGFELAQYVNRRNGGTEEECIAFRRLMQRRSGGGESGFARMVLGFGCTTEARDTLIETLKQLDAPGG